MLTYSSLLLTTYIYLGASFFSNVFIMTMNFTPPNLDLNHSHSVVSIPAKENTQPSFYRTHFKRAFDIVFSIVTLALISPIVLILAALIALDGYDPFYTQLRVGKGGKHFRIWKLRTMVFNADDLLEAHLSQDPSARIEWDTTQKLKNDPRITRVGLFLRRSSLDELPQLLNILNGTMSLVGPRPIMPCQNNAYSGLAYYKFRPGLTGLWQVSDRNEGEFIGRVRYDERYDRVISFKTDLHVIWQTFGVVLRRTGY